MVNGVRVMPKSSKPQKPKDFSRLAPGRESAIFPGSFDPLTNGHSDIIRRSLTIFSRVTVAVLSNPNKNTLFSVEERLELLEEEFSDCDDKVIVASFSGLLVDYAATIGANIIIRGLRAVSDYDYEAQMALMNKSLSENIETLFLVTREENSYISSSLVKQIASMNGDVSKFVPKAVARALTRKRKG